MAEDREKLLTRKSECDGFCITLGPKQGQKRGSVRRKTERSMRGSLRFEVFISFDHVLYSFLDASSHLYKKVCPSVRPYVRKSVRYHS